MCVGIRENLFVNMQQFLTFWNTYNVTIIEVLIGIIVLTVGFLVYSMTFGKKNESISDSAQIEKTLQKILEAQASNPATKLSGLSNKGVSDPTLGAGATDEVDRLRANLQEKDAQLEQLHAMVAETSAKQAADGAAADQAAVTPGVDVSGLESRIKELEGNLAEYEIISEDIADLSRFKEENARLLKQLDGQKSASPPAPTRPVATGIEPAPAPAQSVEENVESIVEASPSEVVTETVSEAMAEASTEDAAEVVAEIASTEAPISTAETGTEPGFETPSVVDDELMKEFAAAVEGQKNSTVSNETDKLMNDFENFMKKG